MEKGKINEFKHLDADDLHALEGLGYYVHVSTTEARIYRQGEEIDVRTLKNDAYKDYYAGMAERLDDYIARETLTQNRYNVYFYAQDEMDEFYRDVPDHEKVMEPVTKRDIFSPGIFLIDARTKSHWVNVDEIIYGDEDTYKPLFK
jgi:hypothetical protein